MPTAPSVRNVGAQAQATASTKIDLTAPTCTDGDILLAFIADYPTTTSQRNQDPSLVGWTTVVVAKDVPFSARLAVLKKTASSDSGVVHSFTINSDTKAEGCIIAFKDTAGVDVSAGSTGASIATAPSVTTTKTDCLVVDGWTLGPVIAMTLSPAATNRLNVAGTTGHMPLAVSTQSAPTPGATGTHACSASSGSPSNSASATVALYPNQTPNAPTLTAPAVGETFDRASTYRFGATFSDPDVGDAPTASDWRYRIVGSPTWTTVSQTSANQYHDFAGGTFAAGDYEWQVRYTDSVGNVGPYSGSGFFTAGDVPAAPTITAPTGGSTIGDTPTAVTWTVGSQQAYQVRKVADASGSPDTGTVYYDPGQVTDTATRSLSVAFPINNRYEHVQVRIKTGGLWSAWASVRVHVDYDLPPAPDVSIETFDADAAIGVTWTTAAPGAGEVAAVTVDLYRSADAGATSIRIATGLDPDDGFIDYTPASGVDYSYQTVAVAATGTESPSGWIGASTEGIGGVYGSGY